MAMNAWALGSVRQLGALLIERALGRYPTTLDTDEALLREDDVAGVEEATASLRAPTSLTPRMI